MSVQTEKSRIEEEARKGKQRCEELEAALEAADVAAASAGERMVGLEAIQVQPCIITNSLSLLRFQCAVVQTFGRNTFLQDFAATFFKSRTTKENLLIQLQIYAASQASLGVGKAGLRDTYESRIGCLSLCLTSSKTPQNPATSCFQSFQSTLTDRISTRRVWRMLRS